MLAKRLNVDVADRPKRHPPAGRESMDQPLAFDVRTQLLMDGQHCFGTDQFKLELAFVSDTIVNRKAVLLFALHGMTHQQASTWKRVMATGADFSQG